MDSADLLPPLKWNSDNSPSPPEAVSSTRRQLSERQILDSGASSRAAVAVACTACRNRHLKCDGQRPCGRCSTEKMDCSYIKSRRGWKGPKRQPGGPSLSPRAGENTATNQPFLTISPGIDTSVLDNSIVGTHTTCVSPDGRFQLDFLGATDSSGQIVSMPPPPAQLPLDTSRVGLINAFYTFFFPAHPFLLPHHSMLDQFAQNSDLQHLDLALQYVGSFYVVGANTHSLHHNLHIAIRDSIGHKDAFYVQAMMLLAMGLHMADQLSDSISAMYGAIQCALELGMYRQSYSTDNGISGTVAEECLRRTWWELFVWDGIFCGINPRYNLQLGNVPLEVALPMNDEDYINGETLSIPRSLEDYDEAAFLSDEEIVFSSGTYRIDAVRIIHRVLAATRASPVDIVALDLADTHLANWALHLPDCRKKVINRDGKVDEVLFTAHMVIASCSTMLHRPRSDLFWEDVKQVTTCVSSGPMNITSGYKDMHTAKAVRAAMDICVLIKMPSPLIKHTPFFTCAITLSAVTYLSYWSYFATQDADHLIKEHIKLNIGSLKSLSAIMPIAKTVLVQVKSTAHKLFRDKKALNNVYWMGVTREEAFQSMIEETTHTNSQGSLLAPASTPGWDITLFNGLG